ncbi:MAG TPA: cupin domain-containing protein [Bryobacteraceae bacterium]|nr:cupin domain-containing protein [Bryobacteraceae bacterium]
MFERKRTMLFCVLAGVFAIGANLVADSGKRERRIFEGPLAHVPGQTLTAEVVEFSPGHKSAVHHHAGSVFAYVLTGSIRSQNSATGPAKIYKAGETFFEPAGSDHLITENPSSTEPASLLAIHVAKDGAALTMPGTAK